MQKLFSWFDLKLICFMQATATSSKGLTGIVISIDGSTSARCTINGGGVVSFVQAGSCLLNFNHPGNSLYNAALQVQFSLNITKGSQLVTFSSSPPAPAVVFATYTVTATASSGLSPTFAVVASSATVCSIAGGNVVSFLTGIFCAEMFFFFALKR